MNAATCCANLWHHWHRWSASGPASLASASPTITALSPLSVATLRATCSLRVVACLSSSVAIQRLWWPAPPRRCVCSSAFLVRSTRCLLLRRPPPLSGPFPDPTPGSPSTWHGGSAGHVEALAVPSRPARCRCSRSSLFARMSAHMSPPGTWSPTRPFPSSRSPRAGLVPCQLVGRRVDELRCNRRRLPCVSLDRCSHLSVPRLHPLLRPWCEACRERHARQQLGRAV